MKAKLSYLLFLNTSYSDVKRLFTVFIKFLTKKFRYTRRLDKVFTITCFSSANLHKYIHKYFTVASKYIHKKSAVYATAG